MPPASVCGTAASTYSGRFLHIEQDPGFRAPSDWNASVTEVWSGSPAAPAAPTNLSATPDNAQVSLSWSASSGADSYRVHRGTVSGGPYTTIASGLSATSHLDTTVSNGTTYFYVATAVNAGGESANSNQASATPQVPAVPAAPTGLTASASGKKKIALAWNAVSGATSYTVKRSTTTGGPYTNVATITGTSYTNTGLTSGVTYYYVVSAANAQGSGPNSSQAGATAR